MNTMMVGLSAFAWIAASKVSALEPVCLNVHASHVHHLVVPVKDPRDNDHHMDHPVTARMVPNLQLALALIRLKDRSLRAWPPS